MTKTRDNHYVPQWHQKGFIDERDNQLCHLTRRIIDLKNGQTKVVNSKKWYTSTQQFYKKDLYSTFFGTKINDDIEQKLFGPIDDNGSKAIRAFLTDDQSQWHHNFQDLFTYLDAQKLRTPKGLDWIQTKYLELTQLQLMTEMQSLRSIHCTFWAEGVRELVSAENSDVKFIVSDHPVTIYNHACPPDSELCRYPNDPDIALKGSQTIFPLDKNRCLILTNLEYAQDPENSNPLEQRANATRLRHSMVSTIEFIKTRKLTVAEVTQINHVIKSRSQVSVAAGKEDWLYPENDVTCEWGDLRHVLLPPKNEINSYTDMYAKFEDGSIHYQDAYGRTAPQNQYLNKYTDEAKLGVNDPCGCGSGSGKKYKKCCRTVSSALRTTWDVASIRERNLAFCKCIRDKLGLDRGKTWLDVRRELSDVQISEIYGFYSVLWPLDTDIYSLLPKSDGKFRGLYTGSLDVRTISKLALPMASVFDEFLIETPITNPNNVKPEFSPVKSPSKYKYQALKDFMFMLELEPFIGLGLVNLIPDPSEFDLELMRNMMDMARDRSSSGKYLCEQDRKLHFHMMIEDFLNSISMMPKDAKIRMLMHQFEMDEKVAGETIDVLELNAEASPLMMLQKVNFGEGGQFYQLRMGPNYEMTMLIAQVTGSVVVTDSGSRWQEMILAQHRNQGIVTYPWSETVCQLNTLPIDYQLLKTLRKSHGYFATARDLLKSSDRLVLNDNRNEAQLARLSAQISNFVCEIGKGEEPSVMSNLKILSPDGGFHDAMVQRLLAKSNCPKYDNKVRSVYGVGIPD
ncbi:hypothetical protein TUM4261_03940 [Shewanella sp. c952]|uniref:DUF4238 domain-containing protein n=1 Tax=Shewanella sp. c952 TaxID=2815913 RepID=UPI001BC2D31D|nr:DUF4238 domain-containing protein [Shewanella sp. c952]GIU04301.1 hypothetical protein TUM4261_03940 [Shewanella sp. c952]